jgi:glycine cleavage system H protein
MYPSHLRYTREHEWIAVEGDTGTVGITEFAQHELGDIVYLDLGEPGRSFKSGEALGTIESVKAVSELFAPVSGTLVEVNAALADAPDQVNKDPYGAGWLCRIRLTDPSEIDALMDAATYEASLAS